MNSVTSETFRDGDIPPSEFGVGNIIVGHAVIRYNGAYVVRVIF